LSPSGDVAARLGRFEPPGEGDACDIELPGSGANWHAFLDRLKRLGYAELTISYWPHN
jgi:hypothetical protein